MAIRALRTGRGDRRQLRLLRHLRQPHHLPDGAPGPVQRLRRQRLVGDGKPHAPARRIPRRRVPGPVQINHPRMLTLRPGVWHADSVVHGACAAPPPPPPPPHLLPSSSSTLQVQAFFYVSLYLIALAQGADKPCGLAFAAEQFDANHLAERASRASLFNWWFFCMAISISVAVAVVGYIQDNVGWGVGFGVPCAIVLAAFAVFLMGTPTYRLYHHQQQQQRRHKKAIAAAAAANCRRLLPIWATSLVYGVVYAQIMTLFNKQGRTLDRRLVRAIQLPPAALQTLGPPAS
ncbi:hypothetical protein PVAP13_7KG361601 [Panicum virgatum]|uniref:Uncharacterized protein n=1 Tax=Panicum virgatum TaxID=38727 RepID=A0A8T0QS40_PANVG|nr:hypothetical protein PVAP13_7KG361601 [Panicum virgatum]